MFVAQKDKAVMEVFSRTKDQQKCAMPETVDAVALLNDAYILAGGRSGMIYTWDLDTGELLRSWKGHYRAVSAIVVSEYIISGGMDALIHVWDLCDTLDVDVKSLNPVCTFSNHTLPIHCLEISTAWLASCSLDKTVKLFNVAAKDVIASFSFPCPLRAVVVDPVGRALYTGGDDGKVYSVSIVSPNDKNRLVLGTHTSAVTCLRTSIDGSRVISGSIDGTCHIYDTLTRLLVRSIEYPASVAAIYVGPMFETTKKFRPLYKYASSKQTMETHWIPIQLQNLNQRQENLAAASGTAPGPDAMMNDSSNPNSNADVDIEAKLRSQIATLEEENARWRTVNSKLYSIAISRSLQE